MSDRSLPVTTQTLVLNEEHTMPNSRCQDAWSQIQSARAYTLAMIEDVDREEWYTMPPGLETHVAWQIGHVAMAEYGLALFRRRGRRDEDRSLLPGSFRRDFAKGSTPAEVSGKYSAEQLLEVLSNIHTQVERELAECSDEELQQPVDMPFAGQPTKLGALWFCAHHEMLHAGQIGLIRRAMGKQPLR